MKKYALSLMGITLLAGSTLVGAPLKSNQAQRFYGKLTEMNLKENTVKVFSKSKKMEETFSWNENTQFVRKSKSISPQDIEVGQSLIVYYTKDQNPPLVYRITVRQSRRSQSTSIQSTE